jgi:hypothetical protein
MKLKKDIRAELDEDLLKQFHGTVSLPFERVTTARSRSRSWTTGASSRSRCQLVATATVPREGRVMAAPKSLIINSAFVEVPSTTLARPTQIARCAWRSRAPPAGYEIFDTRDNTRRTRCRFRWWTTSASG